MFYSKGAPFHIEPSTMDLPHNIHIGKTQYGMSMRNIEPNRWRCEKGCGGTVTSDPEILDMSGYKCHCGASWVLVKPESE